MARAPQPPQRPPQRPTTFRAPAPGMTLRELLAQKVFGEVTPVRAQHALNYDPARGWVQARTAPDVPRNRPQLLLQFAFSADPQMRATVQEMWAQATPRIRDQLLLEIAEAYPQRPGEGAMPGDPPGTSRGYSPMAQEVIDVLNGGELSPDRAAAVRAAEELNADPGSRPTETQPDVGTVRVAERSTGDVHDDFVVTPEIDLDGGLTDASPDVNALRLRAPGDPFLTEGTRSPTATGVTTARVRTRLDDRPALRVPTRERVAGDRAAPGESFTVMMEGGVPVRRPIADGSRGLSRQDLAATMQALRRQKATDAAAADIRSAIERDFDEPISDTRERMAELVSRAREASAEVRRLKADRAPTARIREAEAKAKAAKRQVSALQKSLSESSDVPSNRERRLPKNPDAVPERLALRVEMPEREKLADSALRLARGDIGAADAVWDLLRNTGPGQNFPDPTTPGSGVSSPEELARLITSTMDPNRLPGGSAPDGFASPLEVFEQSLADALRNRWDWEGDSAARLSGAEAARLSEVRAQEELQWANPADLQMSPSDGPSAQGNVGTMGVPQGRAESQAAGDPFFRGLTPGGRPKSAIEGADPSKPRPDVDSYRGAKGDERIEPREDFGERRPQGVPATRPDQGLLTAERRSLNDAIGYAHVRGKVVYRHPDPSKGVRAVYTSRLSDARLAEVRAMALDFMDQHYNEPTRQLLASGRISEETATRAIQDRLDAFAHYWPEGMDPSPEYFRYFSMTGRQPDGHRAGQQAGLPDPEDGLPPGSEITPTDFFPEDAPPARRWTDSSGQEFDSDTAPAESLRDYVLSQMNDPNLDTGFVTEVLSRLEGEIASVEADLPPGVADQARRELVQPIRSALQDWDSKFSAQDPDGDEVIGSVDQADTPATQAVDAALTPAPSANSADELTEAAEAAASDVANSPAASQDAVEESAQVVSAPNPTRMSVADVSAAARAADGTNAGAPAARTDSTGDGLDGADSPDFGAGEPTTDGTGAKPSMANPDPNKAGWLPRLKRPGLMAGGGLAALLLGVKAKNMMEEAMVPDIEPWGPQPGEEDSQAPGPQHVDLRGALLGPADGQGNSFDYDMFAPKPGLGVRPAIRYQNISGN